MKLNNRRLYPGAKQPAHKAKFRQEEAKERQQYWEQLSPIQKLNALDLRLGVGIGAKKQRKRLAALLEQSVPSHE